MVDATALGAVVAIRVGSSPSISKFYIWKVNSDGSESCLENSEYREVWGSTPQLSASFVDVIGSNPIAFFTWHSCLFYRCTI